MIGGVAIALGVQSSGTSQSAASQKSVDDPGAAARIAAKSKTSQRMAHAAHRGTDGDADTGPADLSGAGSAQRTEVSQPVCAMGAKRSI